MEAGAVVADRVSADGWRGVFKLLRDVFDHCLAVQAQEGATHLKTQGRQHEQAFILLLPSPLMSSHCELLLCAWGKSYQLRVNWMRPHHLPTNPNKCADPHGRQLADPT